MNAPLSAATPPPRAARRRAPRWRALCRWLSAAVVLGASAVASAEAPAQAGTASVELSSLRRQRDTGAITQDEYDRAIRDLEHTAGSRAPDSPTLVVGSVSATLYGFVEAHAMYDTTQSFSDSPNNVQVARPGTYAAEHHRLQLSVRDTRFGFRFKGPDIGESVHTSATLEMDFFATLPSGVSEAATFDSSPLRLRHAMFKVETPVVDVLVGQYWDLFGWQPLYVPPSVQFSGVPGNLFGRTPQLRLSKAVKLGGLTLEGAVAALRPPQRDAAVPEGQAGLRLSVDGWTAVQTVNSTTTLISPASLAVTGDLRKVAVKELAAAPARENTAIGGGLAVGAFLPILPGTKEKKGNSLAVHGELAIGKGIADLYTGLVGGVDNPPLPAPDPDTPAPAYTPNIDPGIAVYDRGGRLWLVQWTTFLVGAQYTLPGLDGRVFAAANYARVASSNSKNLGDPAKVRTREDWFDVAFWVDPAKPLRFGLEYAYFNDTYADGARGVNHRGEVSAFWFF